MSVGADIQFRIWNPVMSVVALQDLKASTRLTAQNAMTQTLGKRTVREIQTERVKLGEHLGVSGQIRSDFFSIYMQVQHRFCRLYCARRMLRINKHII